MQPKTRLQHSPETKNAARASDAAAHSRASVLTHRVVLRPHNGLRVSRNGVVYVRRPDSRERKHRHMRVVVAGDEEEANHVRTRLHFFVAKFERKPRKDDRARSAWGRGNRALRRKRGTLRPKQKKQKKCEQSPPVRGQQLLLIDIPCRLHKRRIHRLKQKSATYSTYSSR